MRPLACAVLASLIGLGCGDMTTHPPPMKECTQNCGAQLPTAGQTGNGQQGNGQNGGNNGGTAGDGGNGLGTGDAGAGTGTGTGADDAGGLGAGQLPDAGP